MSVWAWPAVVFAGILLIAAIRRRRYALALRFAVYGLLAAAMAAGESPVMRFVAPLAVLLAGYWLTAPFYTSPSPRLEARLLRYDDALAVDRVAAAAPRWLKALVEMTYLGCYPFIVVAAIPAFRQSADAFAWHWTLVLSAELACYVTLPWLQARPPRAINGAHFLRRFNEVLLDRLSVRATTIPSGHVAGPIAAALSVWMIAPEYGPWLLAGAAIIAIATVIGRYHYAIDALLGLLVGVIPPAIRSFWS